MPEAKEAFIYSRLSTPEQRKGRGKGRQNEGALNYVKAKGWLLNTSLDLHEEASAFRGLNATHGKLKAFLDAIEDGRVKPGSVLVVESLDRLSRQEVSDALELVLGILRNGVEIVTLIPDPMHFKKNPDLTQLIIALVILARANEESAVKSVRHRDNWQEFRERMRAGMPVGKMMPKWLEPSEDGKRFLLKAPVVKTIKRIFKDYLAGSGTHLIAEALNDEGVKPLQHGKRWSSGQVRHVLTNRQLIGERQFRIKIKGKLQKEGTPFQLFPVVIDEDTFARAQGELERRATVKVNRRHKPVTNLFTNLIASANGRGELIDWIIAGAVNHITIAGPRKAKSGRKKRYHLPYNQVEQGLLSTLAELDVRGLVEGAADKLEALEAARARLQEAQQNLVETQQGLKKRYSDTLAKIAQELETDLVKLQAEVERREIESRSSGEGSIDDLQALIRGLRTKQGNDLLLLRQKLKSRIRQTVSKIVIVDIEERSEQDRTITMTLHFHHWQRVRIVQFTIKRNYRSKGIEIDRVRSEYLSVDPVSLAKQPQEVVRLVALVHDLGNASLVS